MASNRIVVLALPILTGLIVKFVGDPETAYAMALALVAGALMWLKGWQQWERFEQELELIMSGQDDPAAYEALTGPDMGIEDLTPAAQAAARASGLR